MPASQDKYDKKVNKGYSQWSTANLFVKIADFENAYDFKKIIEIDPENYEAIKGH